MGVFTICVAIYIVLSLQVFEGVLCWDSEDLEIFDLVEEVNQNFYDVLNISMSADGAELRRSYRRLSLQLHPDKNKEADAEAKFRQLVAVYEVLKDEKKRTKYNEVLANGLPDWRQPVYYYRRARKMGLVELSILLSIIITTGHFITIWSIYLEKRFEKEEVFRARKNREKKTRRGRLQNEDDAEDELEEELSHLKRPLLTDMLPFTVSRLTVQFIVSLPRRALSTVESIKLRLVKHPCDESDDDQSPVEKVRPIRKRPNLAGPAPETLPCDFLPYTAVKSLPSDQFSNEESYNVPTSGGDWTDVEIAALSKAMARYPGGTSDRWQKVSQMVGRSVKEVTAKSHEVKTQYARSVDPCSQGITATRLPDCSPLPESENLNEYELSNYESSEQSKLASDKPLKVERKTDAQNNSAKPQMKKIDRTLMISQTTGAQSNSGARTSDTLTQGVWSQQQQRLLEVALNQHPKGTPERWERVAELVPGKTKEECMQRFKYLAELVVKKKKQQLDN